MNEAKASRYHRLQRRVRALSIVLTAGLLMGLMVTDAAHGLRDLATRLVTSARLPGVFHLPGVVVLYGSAVGVAAACVTLPLSFYGESILERRYHLTDETATSWLRHHLHGAAIVLALAVSGAVLVYELLRIFPTWWWVVATGVVALASALAATVAPALPLLSGDLERLEREPLSSRLRALLGKAGVPTVEVHRWRMSGRTRRGNAVFVGLGRTRRILVSDTVLAAYDDDEIEVMVAHEVAHYAHRDIWRGLAFETASAGAVLWVGHITLRFLGPSFGLSSPADVAGVPLLLLAGGAVMLVLTPFGNHLSRGQEHRADCYALELTGNRDAFVSLLRRLGAQNLAEPRPARAVALFHSHPSLDERLNLAERWGRRPGYPSQLNGT